MQAVSIMLIRSIKYTTPEVLINCTYYLFIKYLLCSWYNKHNILCLIKFLNGVISPVFTVEDTEAQSY